MEQGTKLAYPKVRPNPEMYRDRICKVEISLECFTSAQAVQDSSQ